MKTIKCRICGKRYLPQAIRNHILKKAVQEVYNRYGLNKKDKLKHQRYIEKNSIKMEFKTIQI